MASTARTGYWLFKEEPTHYNYAKLEQEGRTRWDGINNALARRYLSEVRAGDRVLFYHTGNEKAVVGEMTVAALVTHEQGTVPELVPVRRWTHPVTLARIKNDPALREWELVRLPRLSVVPVTIEQWQRLEQLSAEQE